jgi:hypothetical protein
MKTTIYRADNYNGNMGDLEGFFFSLVDAKLALNFKTEVLSSPQSGNFGEIYFFTADINKESFVTDIYGRINDEEQMLQIWGENEYHEVLYFA